MVAAIHTPSSAAFFAFDKLLLLDAGRLCYLGAVSETVRFFSEAGFQCPTYHNPADFVIETLSSSDDAPAKLKRQHEERIGAAVEEGGGGGGSAAGETPAQRGAAKPPPRASRAVQLRTLIHRNFRSMVAPHTLDVDPLAHHLTRPDCVTPMYRSSLPS